MLYYLNFLPEKECFILHNLRLFDGKSYFQIDYLLVTPYFALILECKNNSGILSFDTSLNQFSRRIKDQEEGFLGPISQVKRLKRQLHQFLQKNKLPTLPIEYLIVISQPSTIIKGDYSIKNQVIHSHSLIEKWDNLTEIYKKAIVDGKKILHVSKLLLKTNVPELEIERNSDLIFFTKQYREKIILRKKNPTGIRFKRFACRVYLFYPTLNGQ